MPDDSINQQKQNRFLEVMTANPEINKQRRMMISQAKVGAEYIAELMKRRHLTPETTTILDIGCGGRHTRESGYEYEYFPYFLGHLSDLGFTPENMYGVDIGVQNQDLTELYTHLQLNLVPHFTLDPNNARKKIYESMEDYADRLFMQLPESLKQRLSDSVLLLCSNNFFANMDPTLLSLVDPEFLKEYLEYFFSRFAKVGSVMITFDESNNEEVVQGPSVFVINEQNKLIENKEEDSILKLKFYNDDY